MHRRPTHRAVVRTLVRSHVARLNTCIYGTQVATEGDDFVLYFIHDNDCDGTIVTLHINDEFIAAPQRWVALLIQRKPYLISRAECLTKQNIDNTVQLDLRRIINIPVGEEDDGNAPPLRQTSLSQPLGGTQGMFTTTVTTSGSSFRERNNEILVRRMRRKHTIYVETTYQPFSLARHIKTGGLGDDEELSTDMLQYLKIVIDYALIAPNFANPEHRLIMENKLLSVCHNDANIMLPLQHLALVDFLLNVILCETDVPPLNIAYLEGTGIRYQFDSHIRWRLLDECVAWEVFKLRRNRDRHTLTHYHTLIAEFLELTHATTALIPLPAWTSYCIDETTPHQYWAHDDEDRIVVRFEWLPALVLEGIPATISVTDRLVNGFVWLNATEFHDYFVPCLYRRLLADSFRYIWMLRLADRQSRVSQLVASVSQSNFRTHIWPHLPVLDSRTLYEYSKAHIGHIVSPITKKLAKRERMTPKHASNGGNQPFTYQEAARIATDVDIEEVNRYMPPCIKPFIKKGVKLGYMDRVTAVTYLGDMGYGRGETVRLLNGNDKHDITGVYDSYTTKKQRPENAEKLLSLYCGALIAIDGSFGHAIRCPYEELENGAKRKPKEAYTADEKRIYRLKCTETLGPNAKTTCITSPIDYVRHKMKNNTSV